MRTKLKKLTSVCLAFIMILGILTVAPISVGAVISGDLKYKLLDDNTVEITGYSGKPEEIIFPSEIDGYKVTSIGESAFYQCISLKSVTIGNEITNIGVGAFSGCTNLESLTILDSVTNISKSAFFMCRSLTNITIPGNVNSIGNSAFYECKSLKSVTICEGVTNIGEYAFYNSTDLINIIIPDSVTSIGYYALGYYRASKNQFEKVDGFTLYGYNATAAEEFANKNGFIFISLDGQEGNTYIDPNTNISVTACVDAELAVRRITDNEKIDAVNNTISDDAELLGLYDILLVSNGVEVQPSGIATVRIPSAYKNIKIYKFEENGTLIGINAVCENNYIVFEAEHLGAYAVVQEKKGSAPDGLAYEIHDDGTIEITEYSGAASVMIIPDQIAGYDVTTIAEYAFENCSTLTEITIPESITKIGRYAFRGCANLETVYYNAVSCDIDTYMDNHYWEYTFFSVFEDCPSFTALYIGENVRSISRYAFVNCTSLSTVYYNAVNCTNANPYENYLEGVSFTPTFEGCTSFTTLYIGKDVQRIPNYLFVNCTNLSTVYFNAVNCTDMKSGHFGVRTYYPTNGTPYDSEEFIVSSAFKYCSSLTNVIFADNVRTIPEYAFYDCKTLKNISIPASVTDIGKYALGYVFNTYPIYRDNGSFYGYKYVDEVDESFIIYGYTQTEAEEYATKNKITFTELGEDTFKSVFEYIVLDDGTAEITEYIGSAIDITIPYEIDGYTVSSIGARAFKDCLRITAITVPDNITNLDIAAFSKCPNLTSVTMGSGLTSIPDYAFSSAESLTNLTIGNNVEIIGNSAFYNCTSIENIIIPDSVTLIGNSAFKKCEKLESIVIPDSVTIIDGHAFENCSSLKEVKISKNVNSIKAASFAGCLALGSVTVPDSVSEIGNYALGYYYDGVNYKKIDGFTIYGYTGSEAETYASGNGFAFVSIGEGPAPTLGDVNGDGKISIDDVTDIQKYIANMLNFTENQETLADVNKDGKISIDDVTLIQKYLAGMAEI